MNNHFALLPSVEEILNTPEVRNLPHSHEEMTPIIRDEIQKMRLFIKENRNLEGFDLGTAEELKARLLVDILVNIERGCRSKLRRVINATGVILHTNLGRAVLSEKAMTSLNDINSGYSNLELSLETGMRSMRYDCVEDLLKTITGAEDCLVVNNNAAAVLLALDVMGTGKEAILSRGELVEIGGSFRVPEVMEKSGVLLKEIGTTNKTHLHDYVRAIGENTGLILSVHPSNFAITGFTESVALVDLVELGHKYDIPVMYDWGAGNIYPLNIGGRIHDESVINIVKTGVDVLTFSGDKLLGGPQAGIILGKKKYLQKMKENPLLRAFRVDKMTLAALEATLKSYVNPVKAVAEIPTLQMLFKDIETIEKQACKLADGLQEVLGDWVVKIEDGESQVGGGSLPDVKLPTKLVTLLPPNGGVNEVAARLRNGKVAVMVYISGGKIVLDSRTIGDGENKLLIEAFAR